MSRKPARHGPGSGGIDFRNVFGSIHEPGGRHTGQVPAEYDPTDGSFKDPEPVKAAAAFA